MAFEDLGRHVLPSSFGMFVLGIDVGGTFTDFVAHREGNLFLWKTPPPSRPRTAFFKACGFWESGLSVSCTEPR